MSHRDIKYHKQHVEKNLDMIEFQKINYYIAKRSIAFEYVEDYEGMKSMLRCFRNHPLYYAMLILEDKKGMSPLQLAMEKNSTKVIEIILSTLCNLNHFSLSKKVLAKFSLLFKMKLDSFEAYLNSCYFVTEQMKSISQIQLRNDQGVIRDHYSCTILDADFYKKYNIPMKKSQMTYMKSKAQNAVVPSQSISEIQVSDNSEQMLSNNKDILKRVSLRAIEIDWIFKGDRASSFLKELSDTENLEIFNLDIIKDIILLQWKYFKIAIILKLFLPYLLYFAMF